ncbi:unnamed protein product [Vitrella brassicaformis CCMP3155]|uniref:Uncharacterized protein n=2 Tax=Vitrella brassicaformis TaxID=1169539 RepID=A0A0G4G5A9_VITBC|nr:unnamed protein product [Vitrella brassicaformis CCMP3155]|eukprot:CEM23729.1 unnamed protein product [Vitrella brassicaformis CCMP3155]
MAASSPSPAAGSADLRRPQRSSADEEDKMDTTTALTTTSGETCPLGVETVPHISNDEDRISDDMECVRSDLRRFLCQWNDQFLYGCVQMSPPLFFHAARRYQEGTRVWMVTDKRPPGEQKWVTAEVYRTEETDGGVRLFMREVDGRHEKFEALVPYQADLSLHDQREHESFRFVCKAPGDGSRAGWQHPLFNVPQDVQREVLFPLLGDDLAISLAHLRRTCRLGNQRVSADISSIIDHQLIDKGIQRIISYDLTATNLLLRLLCFIDNGSDWAVWGPIINVAKHHGRVRDLPMTVTSNDVEGVGSRRLFDSRIEALRQLSLIGRHLYQSDNSSLRVERIDNEERLSGRPLPIRAVRTLDFEYASVHDAVLHRTCHGGPGMSMVASKSSHDFRNVRHYTRMWVLATQPPPIWNRHTVSTGSHTAFGYSHRMIVLHGDQPDDHFEAHIIVHRYDSYTSATLFSTERPVEGREGAARFPLTVQVAREVMGADAQVVFGNQLAVF